MAEAKKTTTKKAPVAKTETPKKEAPKKVAPKKEEEVKETPVKEEKKRINRYHISLDPKDKKWKVFLAGSTKVIKKFNTQKEAIGYTQNLTDNNDRGIVVHGNRTKRIRKI